MLRSFFTSDGAAGLFAERVSQESAYEVDAPPYDSIFHGARHRGDGLLDAHVSPAFGSSSIGHHHITRTAGYITGYNTGGCPSSSSSFLDVDDHNIVLVRPRQGSLQSGASHSSDESHQLIEAGVEVASAHQVRRSSSFSHQPTSSMFSSFLHQDEHEHGFFGQGSKRNDFNDMDLQKSASPIPGAPPTSFAASYAGRGKNRDMMFAKPPNGNLADALHELRYTHGYRLLKKRMHETSAQFATGILGAFGTMWLIGKAGGSAKEEEDSDEERCKRIERFKNRTKKKLLR